MSQILVTGEAKIRDIQGPVVSNSGVITALDGDASQYVRGDGTLADFPTSTGGGSSVSYYLNTSVSQGTIGGVAYKQLGKTPISGAGTDIAISTTGYVASYLTDANDPALLEVPAGNFNCEFYFSVNNNTGNPFVYAEVYKYDGAAFTLLGSSVGVPEYITEGTVINPYYFAVPVAVAALTVTDRIAIRIYVNVDGRTVTLHTENNHLCQVVTTFSKGLISLNNLTRQNQFFATGSSGTDFNISSTTDTHTFNIPSASATNRGFITTGNQTIAGNKVFLAGVNVDNFQVVNATLLNHQAGLSPTLVGTTAIGGSANGLFFNVNGNGRIQEFIFDSTGDRDYTFPAATGTIALTSDISYPVTSVFGRTGAVVATEGDYSLTQLSDVTITTPSSGQVLKYNGTLWVNDTDANTGTVTSVGLSSATSGVTIGSSPITTSGTITIAIATASGSLNGLLSSTDWTTFNSKQGTITLTTTGTSGAATLVGATLNIPNYGSALSAYLPLAGGTLTGALSGTSATFSGVITFAGNTRYGVSKIYDASIGDGFGLEQASAAQTSQGVPMTRIFTAATNGAALSLGKYTNATSFTDWLIFASTGAATFSSSVTVGGSSTLDSLKVGTTSTHQLLIGADSSYAEIQAITQGVGFNKNLVLQRQGGNVGIGNTGNSSYKLLVSGNNTSVDSNGQNTIFLSAGTSVSYIDTSFIGGGSYVPMAFGTGGSERMRITSGGLITMNAGETNGGSGILTVSNTTVASSDASPGLVVNKYSTTTTSSARFVQFYAGNITTAMGGIVGNGASNVQFASLSDIREKENINPISGSLNKILALNPVEFDWIKSKEHTKAGFIAQEVEKIFPEYVIENIANDGEEERKGLTGGMTSGIVAVLVKAIQELEARIKQLENK